MSASCSGKVSLGVPLLDKLLPQGIPRRSLLLIVGEGGAGKSLLAQQIVAAALSRGERAVYLSLDDDAMTVYEGFRARNPAVLGEALSSGRLVIVDGYAPRYGGQVRGWERVNSLEPHGLLQSIRGLVERYRLEGCGILVIDSLNPLLLQYETSMVYEFVNALRATITKQGNVFTIATLHTPTSLYADIAAVLEHMVDVYIVVRYHPEALEAGAAVRQLLVKKAKGVPVLHGWVSFMVTGEGIVEARVRVEREKT